MSKHFQVFVNTYAFTELSQEEEGINSGEDILEGEDVVTFKKIEVLLKKRIIIYLNKLSSIPFTFLSFFL